MKREYIQTETTDNFQDGTSCTIKVIKSLESTDNQLLELLMVPIGLSLTGFIIWLLLLIGVRLSQAVNPPQLVNQPQLQENYNYSSTTLK